MRRPLAIAALGVIMLIAMVVGARRVGSELGLVVDGTRAPTSVDGWLRPSLWVQGR